MEFRDLFPIWDRLTGAQQSALASAAVLSRVKKGEIVHNGELRCTGVLLVQTGQLRAYILSDEGREITLYRLFDRDLCMLSASCMVNSLQFDITIAAEKDSAVWIIDPGVYKMLMQESAAMANFTNELMATRFSEVMWLVEQIMWKSMDKRVAAFLLEEAAIEGTQMLRITHESIANHLGTHREVVTRMLRYLQSEGAVALSRGAVELRDESVLRALGGMQAKNRLEIAPEEA